MTEDNVTAVTGATGTLVGVGSFSTEFGDFNTTIGLIRQSNQQDL